MEMLEIVMIKDYLSIDDEVFVFDETLVGQIKIITFTNGTYKWGKWSVPKKYLSGFLNHH